MKADKAFRIAAIVLVGLATVLVAAGVAFIAVAQEPPYTFDTAWGGKGTEAGRFDGPTAIAIAGEELFVADSRNDRIQVFAADGAFSHKWGGPFAINIFGPFNGWFATVTGVAVDRQGNVFAADFYNHRIQKFAADGRFLSRFGTRGRGDGEFEYAVAVAVADDGTVFAADFGNDRITRWRPPARGAER